MESETILEAIAALKMDLANLREDISNKNAFTEKQINTNSIKINEHDVKLKVIERVKRKKKL